MPSHDLSMDAITEWLDALSFEYELENTEFGACMRFSEQVSINFYLEEATIKRMELVVADILGAYMGDMKLTVISK